MCFLLFGVVLLTNRTCLDSDLSSNNLTGTIPALSSFSRLVALDLHKNRLTGAIPSFPNFSSALTDVSDFLFFSVVDFISSFACLRFRAGFADFQFLQRFLVQLAHWVDPFNFGPVQSYHAVSLFVGLFWFLRFLASFFVFADSRSYLNDNQLDGSIPDPNSNLQNL